MRQQAVLCNVLGVGNNPGRNGVTMNAQNPYTQPGYHQPNPYTQAPQPVQQYGPYNQQHQAPAAYQPAPMVQQPARYVVREHRQANHGLHLILTFLTCGVWAFTGWPIAAILGRSTKTTSTPYQY